MALTKRQVSKLNKALAMIQDVLKTAASEAASGKTAARSSSGPRRTRRTAAQAEKMRADILAKRAKGVPATTLAEKYGVSTAYIYMIKD